MDYVSLGKRIRAKRQEHKWTQAQLAKSVGLSVSFLGHVERGSRKASLETIVALANAMDVSVDYLLADSLRLSEQNPIRRIAMREIVQHITKDLDAWVENNG